MAAANTDKFRKAARKWTGQLDSSGISNATATSWGLLTAAGLPTDTAIDITIDRVDSSGKLTPEFEEVATVVISGNGVINAIRGVEGTAQAHGPGAVVELRLTATQWNAIVDGMTAEHNQNGSHKLDTDGTLSSNLDTKISSQKATKTYVDTQVSSYDKDNIFRQALINGNFDIWQRGTNFVAGANNDDVYTADRWNLISDGNDAVDISQESTEVPEGSTYSMKWDVETAKRFGIVQFLEFKDAKKLQGKTVSLSFQVKSANIAAIRAAVLSWAGTADTLTSDIVATWANTPTWAANWTAENEPADLEVTSDWTTVKIENIVIDSATVNNLAIALWLPNQETIGDIIYISQVQVNVGSVALTFQPKSYEEELRSCQRYYESGNTRYDGYVTNGVVFSTPTFYKMTKRIQANPVLVNTGVAGFSTTTGYIVMNNGNGHYSRRTANTTAAGAYDETWTVDAEL